MAIYRPARPSRRRFLRGLGGLTLSLPFLETFGAGSAHAGGSAQGPKRMLVFLHKQGTIFDEWLPTGSETSFDLPTLLAPLNPFKDRIRVHAGLDNKVDQLLAPLEGHDASSCTLMTGEMWGAPWDMAVHMGGGPSIETVVSRRIKATVPYSRIDLVAGTNDLLVDSDRTRVFYAGQNDPIYSIANPVVALDQLFAGDEPGAGQELAAVRARRQSVLDTVLGNFDTLQSRVSAADRIRLEAHADKVRELELRLTIDTSGCNAPTVDLPPGYDFVHDDNVTAPVMIDIMTMALACDLTRVGTVAMGADEGPRFAWTDYEGGPVVPEQYSSWHDMVHAGQDIPQLMVGFQSYSDHFAYLLERLAATEDVDGDNLLDTTLVLWISDMGDGSWHTTYSTPVVLAGNAGAGVPMGRWSDLQSQHWSEHLPNDYALNQLYVSILRAFGGDDTQFGLVDDLIPTGGLPGLL